MTVYLATNLAALYVTAGALVGLPVGYALGWLFDPAMLPRLFFGVLWGVWGMDRQLRELTAYTMLMGEGKA